MALALGARRPPFDFWRSTRFIGPEEPGPIHEFPYFTFLYGDLHAHMLSMPLQVAAVAVGLQAVRLHAAEIVGGSAGCATRPRTDGAAAAGPASWRWWSWRAAGRDAPRDQHLGAADLPGAGRPADGDRDATRPVGALAGGAAVGGGRAGGRLRRLVGRSSRRSWRATSCSTRASSRSRRRRRRRSSCWSTARCCSWWSRYLAYLLARVGDGRAGR